MASATALSPAAVALVVLFVVASVPGSALSNLASLPAPHPGSKPAAVGDVAVAGHTPRKVTPDLASRAGSPPRSPDPTCRGAKSISSCVAGAKPSVSTAGWTDFSGSAGRAPPARDYLSMTYDASDGYDVLFGGYNSSTTGLYNDTWKLTAGKWSPISSPTAPSPRRAAPIVYDPVDGYVVLFGGAGPTVLNDTWEFKAGLWTNITSPKPNLTNTPPARFSAGLTFDAGDGYVLLFAGCQNPGCVTSLNDTWKFVGGVWSEISVANQRAPSQRGSDALLWDPAQAATILYGGADPAGTHLNDTWEYRAGAWTSLRVAANPGPLGEAFTVYDSGDGFLLLFGGLRDNTPLPGNAPTSNTWAFSNGSWLNLSGKLSTAPPALWGEGEAGTFDTSLGESILFGGRNAIGADLNQTWSFALPLSASVAVAPVPVVQSEAARVTVSAGGGSLFYHYTYAGLPSACPSRDRPSVTCGFNVSGPVVVTVTVTDTVGAQVMATTAFTVAQRFVPVASASPGIGVIPFAAEINASAPGGVAPISYSWEFGDGTPNGTGSPVRHTYQTVGSFLVVLTATDGLGGVSSSNTTVRTYPALSSTAAATPGVGIAPLRVNFTGSSSGGVPPIAYVWTFADGSSGSAGSPDVSHSYGSPGAFNASLVVVDGQGHSVTISVPIRVVAPLAVTASRSPPNGTAPLTVLFVSAPYGGLSPLNYNWTFGDGAYSSAKSPTHDYLAAGTYAVTVQVRDQLGETASANLSVSVTAPSTHTAPPPPAFSSTGWILVIALLAAAVAAVVVFVWAVRRRKR